MTMTMTTARTTQRLLQNNNSSSTDLVQAPMLTILWYVLSGIVWFNVLYQVYKHRDTNRQTVMNETATGTGTGTETGIGIPASNNSTAQQQPRGEGDPAEYEKQQAEKMEQAEAFVQKLMRRLTQDQTVMVGTTTRKDVSEV